MPTIDAHAHLEPRMLAIPDLLAQLDAAGIDRVILLPAVNDPLPDTPAALLAVFRWLLNSRLHPLARRLNDSKHDSDGNVVLSGKTYRVYRRPDNGAVARAIASHPDRFLGWIFLNPTLDGDWRDELDEYRAVPGFVGVKLHPHWHRFDIDTVLPVARRCDELNLPLTVHLGFGDGGDWQRISDAFPRLRLVLAHAAIPHFRRAWPQIRARQNVWIDLSSPYLSERLVRRAVEVVGPDRAIFGTDAPYGFHRSDGGYDYRHIKGWVERLPLPDAALEAVLGGNAERVLELPGS